MKITAIALATGLAAMTAGTTLHADQMKNNERFCAAANAYRTDVTQLRAMGPHATVGELRTTVDRIQSDADEMEQVSGRMNTPTSRQFHEALKKLRYDVSSVPNDATLEQARGRIQSDIDNARSTGWQVATEAGCSIPENPR